MHENSESSASNTTRYEIRNTNWFVGIPTSNSFSYVKVRKKKMQQSLDMASFCESRSASGWQAGIQIDLSAKFSDGKA